ncbi:hypothetical protein SDC9_180382 [bioreactor metagenome]|uniref:Uncharacterized protein n=1 Tax=bioreactor metagenome TaxID=1076179 RepID=A0A645H4F3_9ZZZZ
MILRIGRQADDGDRTSVEVAVAGDDRGLPRGDALDCISPFAGGLERGLDGLQPGIDRQRALIAEGGTQALEQ